MMNERTSDERKVSKTRIECSAAWGGARAVSEDVAFRVTEVDTDEQNHPKPAWEPCQLTAEEEEILGGRRDLY